MELGLLFTTLLVSQWLEAEMHLRLESQPEVSYFFPFFFCSANNFLQLDYMYVDCDGDIAINTNSLTNRGLEMRASRVLGKFFFFLFFLLLY